MSSRSPEKPAATVGDSSVFLTTLAAQERRVLELRDELKKAEDELLRLKKQWATHEAVRKRNEFRHLEQLQRIKIAKETPGRDNREQDEQRNPLDRTGYPAERSSIPDLLPYKDSRPQVGPHAGTRQTQRKIFSGSRQIRALSLLSQASTPNASLDQPLQESSLRGILSPRSIPGSNKQSPPSHDTVSGPTTRRPNEDLIGTSKQIVEDLREGLKTFFEDIRQATVGEEASSSPDTISNTIFSERCGARTQRGRQSQEFHVPGTSSRRSNKSQADGASSRSNLMPLAPINATRVIEQNSTEVVASRDSIQEVARDRATCDDEEPWDSWDTPTTHQIPPCHRAESVTSESLLSPSIGTITPRSSMSSVDVGHNHAHNELPLVTQGDIPWPMLTKVVPGGLRMTAATLMNEWEKSLPQPVLSDTLVYTATTPLTKGEKAD
ncbi:MAG: hypothetical protein Q9222_000346 [Ikaeria aurantiellina]